MFHAKSQRMVLRGTSIETLIADFDFGTSPPKTLSGFASLREPSHSRIDTADGND